MLISEALRVVVVVSALYCVVVLHRLRNPWKGRPLHGPPGSANWALDSVFVWMDGWMD